MSESLDIEAIKARAEAATRGPWGWRGQDDGSIELRALHSGGLRIISTARAAPCMVELQSEDEYTPGDWVLTADACDGCKAEAAKTQDPWLNYRCSKPVNLDTIWLRGEHFIEPSNKWAVRERPYRNDVERVDHPDAEFVAHAREDIPALIAEVERLRALLAVTA
jgi:hypothetical protein